VRIALELKKISYSYESIHLIQDGGIQHGDEHKKRNPMAQVPSLMLEDGTVINQSLAIIAYLEEICVVPNLLGDTPKKKALIWELSEIINAGTQPLQNLAVLQYVQKEFQADKLAWGRRFITAGLDSFQDRLPHPGDQFCVGEQPSLADLCLIPQLYNARRFSCDMTRWATLLDIESRCSAIDAFTKAHPNQQPDAQP
jgi:maleylacetoacetate isomerase